MRDAATPTRENILWGLRFGLLLAAVIIAMVSVGFIVRPHSPTHQMVRWLPLSGSYLVSGLVCGLVLGLCRPMLTSFSRSVLLGPVILFPFYIIVGIATGFPIWRWDAAYWIIAIVTVIILGALLGGIYWLIFTQIRS